MSELSEAIKEGESNIERLRFMDIYDTDQEPEDIFIESKVQERERKVYNYYLNKLLKIQEEQEAREVEAMEKSFITGYEMGHDHTVESSYSDASQCFVDCKDEILEELKDTQ